MQITALLAVLLRKSDWMQPWGMIWVEVSASQGGQVPGMLRGGKRGLGRAGGWRGEGVQGRGLQGACRSSLTPGASAVCLHHQAVELATP